jgi:hypothetical protein
MRDLVPRKNSNVEKKRVRPLGASAGFKDAPLMSYGNRHILHGSGENILKK